MSGTVKDLVKILSAIKTRRKTRQLAVIVDGPNILRKEVSLDLQKIKGLLAELGRIKVSKVVLDKFAPQKLVEAVNNAGFDTLISSGKVEVDLSIVTMEYIFDTDIDIIVLVTRSASYIPLVYKAKEMGKEVVVVGSEPGFSVALKNAADQVFEITQGATS